jgi:hypothetical protein
MEELMRAIQEQSGLPPIRLRRPPILPLTS